MAERMINRMRPTLGGLVAAGVLMIGVVGAPAIAAAAAPPIRVSDTNRVPSCVTPDRLMAFLRTRNEHLDPRFRSIAQIYKQHGDAWHVRWDYAFFQMLIETNFLTYNRGDGRRGDVDPRQNNFAGIGTTGGGVPGDRFPDVSTGVLAQIQHLVVYSGERIERPVAPRTQLKQDDILSSSADVLRRRAMTFADLAGRWAADRQYGRSIEWVADRYREGHCHGQPELVASARPVSAAVQISVPQPIPPAPIPAVRRVRPAPSPSPFDNLSRSSLGAGNIAAAASTADNAPPQPTCSVVQASYGGSKTLLIRSEREGRVRIAALQVLDGFERSMSESYIASQAAGGAIIGEFATRDAALATAYELCPAARTR